MQYYFIHPVLNKLVPIHIESIINKLENMNLRKGTRINDNPKITVESIQNDMVVLTGDIKYKRSIK